MNFCQATMKQIFARYWC